MQSGAVDTHCHLFLLDGDPAEAVEEARIAGVDTLVCVGIDRLGGVTIEQEQVTVGVDGAALHRRFRVRVVHAADTLAVATDPRPWLEDLERPGPRVLVRSRSEVQEVSPT